MPGDQGKRIARNVFANWAAHLVVVAAGFVLPRFIGDCRGRQVLGVWDFAWSLALYLEFLVLGISAAVERHVSRYRSMEDWPALRRTVNSAFAILLVSFVLGLAGVGGMAWLTPRLLGVSGKDLLGEAQMVVVILGVATALRLPMLAFNGVINGCERFDLSSLINGTSRIVQLAAMVAVLLGGYGLVALALVALLTQCMAFAAATVTARRVCPPLRISPRLVSWHGAKEVLAFGGKAFIYQVSRMLAYQTNAVLTACFLGPASLAVYARQRSLVMHVENVLTHYGRTLTPVASARHARGDRQGLARLMVQASMYDLYIMLPILACLIVLGGPIVEVWMGPAYRASTVMMLLVLGHVLVFSQRGTISVLLGMGRHGLPAVAMLASAAATVVLGLLFLRAIPLGLEGAAVALGIPLTLGAGLCLMICGCRAVGLSMRDYLKGSLPGPMVAVAPFVAWLLIARYLFGEHALVAVIMGLGPGGVILGIVYWRMALPAAIRERIRRLVLRRDRAASILRADLRRAEPVSRGADGPERAR